jgi:plasmid stabilization system protein ParE
MKDTRTSRLARDEFDRIVDELLRDPSQAEDIKDRLRTHLRAEPRRQAREVAAEPAEPDDLWENLPV